MAIIGLDYTIFLPFPFLFLLTFLTLKIYIFEYIIQMDISIIHNLKCSVAMRAYKIS